MKVTTEQPTTGDEALRRLSPRQYQVAARLASGDTSHEIAEQLGISVKTVDTFRGQALQRLGVRNAVELTLLLLRLGVVLL